MIALISRAIPIFNQAAGLLNLLQPVALLGARLYVAWVFFASGLTKIRDWDSTLFLFEEEYYVPLLSPEVAAYMGTAGELGLPILLVLGLISRFGAFGLSFVNVIAVVSLEDIAPAALYGHVIWGLLLALIVLWGAGKISMDRWLNAKFNPEK
jgi:putative oxidoreductase